MKDFNKIVKKYFILLVIFGPLSKLGYALTVLYGQKAVIEYYGTINLYVENYDYFCWAIETINKYLIYLILSLFVFIDLKQYKSVFAIALLTALNPIYGITLFLIFQYALETNKTMGNMKQELNTLINKYAIIISILNITEVLLYESELIPFPGMVIVYIVANIITTIFVTIDLKRNFIRNPIIVFSTILWGILGAFLLLIQVLNSEKQTLTAE